MMFAESTGQDKQDFKYNGKELDRMHGLNWYDYEARYLDNTYGRFTSVDPMAEKYYSWSPYVYVGNNPLKRIDPTGMVYRYVYANEEEGEKGGYYVNDNNEKVEWKEVYEWLNASNENLTDQNDNWGIMSLIATNGGSDGHAWLDFNGKDGSVKTFGLFQQGAIADRLIRSGHYQDSFDAHWRNKYKQFQINYERDKVSTYYVDNPIATTSILITNKQRLLIDMYNLNKDSSGAGTNNNLSWGKLNNCVDYAIGAWEFVTGQNVYSEWFWRDPKNLYKSLAKKGPFINVNIPNK